MNHQAWRHLVQVSGCAGAAVAGRCASLRPRCDDASTTKMSYEEAEDFAAVGYDDFSVGARQLTHLDTFDGLKVVVQKPISPKFFVNQLYQVGDSPDGEGSGYYQLTTQLVNGDGGFAVASVDWSGGIEAQLMVPEPTRFLPFLAKGFDAGKLIAIVPARKVDEDGVEQNPPWFLGELNYHGLASAMAFRLGHNHQGLAGKVFGLNFSEIVTPRLCVGGDFMANETQQTMASVGALFFDDGHVFTAMWRNMPFPEQEGMSYDLVNLQYVRELSDKAKLGADLMCLPSNPQQGQVSFGAEYDLEGTIVKSMVDFDGTVKASVETMLHPRCRFQLAAEMRFGAASAPPYWEANDAQAQAEADARPFPDSDVEDRPVEAATPVDVTEVESAESLSDLSSHSDGSQADAAGGLGHADPLAMRARMMRFRGAEFSVGGSDRLPGARPSDDPQDKHVADKFKIGLGFHVQ